MTALIRHTNWYGFNALVLENEYLCTVIVPELGAKLVSLFDKRNQKEWLVGPGSRTVKKATYGAQFHEQDLSGWDEMFPTIIACPYPGPGEQHGAPLPDHGEVWSLPWDIEQAEEEKLRLRVQGKALPYQLTRTLHYTAPALLEFQYQLTNLGKVSMPYIWAAHPQFVCSLGAEIIFPSHVREVCNTIPASWGWGEPETRFNWPLATDLDKQPVHIDRIGPSSLHRARKFFLMPQVRAAWAGVVHTPVRDWLCLEWDPELVPYLGLWVDEGAVSHESVAAPEPTTGFYDSLAVACEKKEVTVLEPGVIQTWTLRVRLGTHEEPFPYNE